MVFPTHVGMNRDTTDFVGINGSVPHARGDEPGDSLAITQPITCSPRTWG